MGSLVVAGFAVQQAVVVPAFDGLGADAQCSGGFLEWEQPALAQPLRPGGEAVAFTVIPVLYKDLPAEVEQVAGDGAVLVGIDHAMER